MADEESEIDDSQGDDDMLELELEAITTVGKTLQPLPAEVRERVLNWANTRYHAEASALPQRQQPSKMQPPTTAGTSDTVEMPNTLAELFAAADPQTEGEKALIAGYWIQRENDGRDFTAFDANKALKDMGYGVVNITGALDDLIGVRPQLVIQLAKQEHLVRLGSVIR